MTEGTIVAITFQDLSDAASVLSSGSTSPKEVQQSFARFLSASYKLTQHMYKEYREKTGESWKACEFDGWNDVTELCKELRNVDHHERPVTVFVHETYYLRTNEAGPEVAIAGIWPDWSFSLKDQLLPRDDIRFELADPKTGRPSGKLLAPVRTDYKFYLSPSSVPASPNAREARKLLAKIDDLDVRSLTEQCFKLVF